MDRNVDFAAANAPGRVAAARIAAFEAASSAVVHADADPAPARMQLIAAQRLSMPARPSGSDRPAFPLELSLRNELGRRADYSRVKRRIKGWPGNGSRIIKLRPPSMGKGGLVCPARLYRHQGFLVFGCARVSQFASSPHGGWHNAIRSARPSRR